MDEVGVSSGDLVWGGPFLVVSMGWAKLVGSVVCGVLLGVSPFDDADSITRGSAFPR
jgi:hypothetical protein